MYLNIPDIFKKGEGLSVEFKRAVNKLPDNLFETVCAFLNRNGGTVLLGVLDNGTIEGVDADAVQQMKKDIANLSNNPQKLFPSFLFDVQEFVIYRDRVETKNANRPHVYGQLIPGNFEPFPKNPHIIQLFTQIGRSEELGTGIRNVYKYTKAYSGMDNIAFEEKDIFITQVPLGDIFADKKINQDSTISDTVNTQVNEQVSDMAGQVGVQVGVQVEKLLLCMDNDFFTTKEIQIQLGLKQRHKVFTNYIQPALKLGLIEMTIPDKPNSRLQKYRLTEKGKEIKINLA